MGCAVQWIGSGPTGMPKVAIVAALEREVRGLIRNSRRIEREYQGRRFAFFERDEVVVVCGGIGAEAARRASEAVIALFGSALVLSVGFAGALDASLHVGDVFLPSLVIDARDGSRIATGDQGGDGVLVTFMAVAGVEQKAKLAEAYRAKAVDMEAAAVLAAAQAHGIAFGVIKAISDECDFEMPATARFISPEGRFKTGSFVLFAVLRPWLWTRVAALARNSNRAGKVLGAHLAAYVERSRAGLKDTVPAASSTALPVPATDGPSGEGRK